VDDKVNSYLGSPHRHFKKDELRDPYGMATVDKGRKAAKGSMTKNTDLLYL